MKYPQIAIATVLVLAGCTLPLHRAAPVHVPEPAPPAGGPIAEAPMRSTAYQLLEPQATGLTQVVDDGHRTYLTFVHAPPAGLMIFDEGGRAVPFTTGNDSAIVGTVRVGWLIRTPTQSSYAQAERATQGGRVAPGTASLPEVAPEESVQVAAARAQILRAEQRIAGFSGEIDRAEQGDASVSLAQLRAEIEQVQVELNGVQAVLLRVHFHPGSTVLTLSGRAREAIIAAATRAAQVRIRGRADSMGSPAVNARLARGRALHMRRLLIAGGVPAGRLRTSYADGDYIASNATAEGRAQNRRVDLVLVGRNPNSNSTADLSNVGR